MASCTHTHLTTLNEADDFLLIKLLKAKILVEGVIVLGKIKKEKMKIS
jgi:hypothetical protein